MKSFKLYTFIVLTGILFSSCESWLDLKPKGVTLKEDALKTGDDLFYLMNSAYTVVGSGSYLGGRAQIISEVLADHINGSTLDGDWAVIYNRSSSIFEGITNNFYGQVYITIYRANNVLENLEVETDQTKRDNLEGQALFLRALSHFEVVRLYAQPYGYTSDNSHLGVPIKLKTKPEAATRASVKEVYDQVIADLKNAEGLLPATNDGYPTKWAAKALLARVYFQMNDFANAYTYANDVLTNSGISFNTNFNEYSQKFSRDGSSEAIFEIISETLNESGEVVYQNRGSEFTGYFRSDVSQPSMKISSKIYSLGTGDPNDKRAAWYDNTTYSGFMVTKKFNGYDNISVPILTITEMKLIRIESAAENGTNLTTATTDLQNILDRAYGAGIKTAPTTASAIINTVRYERQLELVFEGDYLHQLKRIGVQGEDVVIRNSPWNCPGMVIQFPQNEISQNPGFEKNPEGGC